MLECKSKHTAYDPVFTDFVCPSCLAMNGDFFISKSKGVAGCSFLHEDDELECGKCGHEMSGKQFVQHLMK